MSTSMADTVRKQKQNTIVAYKGSEHFQDWLNGLADSLGLPVTITVDQALRDLAMKAGYTPMPRRVWKRTRRAAPSPQAAA
jgi:hypothetical protein